MPGPGWRKPDDPSVVPRRTRVRKATTQPQLRPAATEPYPQHAKMYQLSTQGWIIRDFMEFMLRERGEIYEFGEIESLIFKFLGVDRLEYEAEAAKLKSEYRWLWEQFKVDGQGTTPAGRAVKPAVARVVQAALPDKEPQDGLSFLLERIRGGKDEHD